MRFAFLLACAHADAHAPPARACSCAMSESKLAEVERAYGRLLDVDTDRRAHRKLSAHRELSGIEKGGTVSRDSANERLQELERKHKQSELKLQEKEKAAEQEAKLLQSKLHAQSSQLSKLEASASDHEALKAELAAERGAYAELSAELSALKKSLAKVCTCAAAAELLVDAPQPDEAAPPSSIDPAAMLVVGAAFASPLAVVRARVAVCVPCVCVCACAWVFGFGGECVRALRSGSACMHARLSARARPAPPPPSSRRAGSVPLRSLAPPAPCDGSGAARRRAAVRLRRERAPWLGLPPVQDEARRDAHLPKAARDATM